MDLALMFLASQQANNTQGEGSFNDQHGQTNAVAGLVGMAFLAKGYRPGAPPYGDVIDRTIDYVLSSPANNGYLGTRGGKMYEHAISTLYLSEVSGMVDARRQRKIDEILPRALKVILDSQNGPKQVTKDGPIYHGGWRYEPDSPDADISVSGWCLMALRSARLGGAPVPKAAIDDAINFVDRCRNRFNGGFGYQPGHRHHSNRRWMEPDASPTRTGVALLCRELSGRHGDETNLKAADFVLRSMPGPRDFLPSGHHEYGTYYCAQAMFQVGGKHWEEFALRMYDHLLRMQESDGAWRNQQGAIYPTAMYVLSLSVSYQQLPIYQR